MLRINSYFFAYDGDLIFAVFVFKFCSIAATPYLSYLVMYVAIKKV